MTYVVAEPCVDVKDKACLDVCPVDCIYEGERTLYIQPDECIDCHACEPVCPVEAIFPAAEVPDEWVHYTEINRTFFDVTSLGSPGGASGMPQQADHPAVAALPATPHPAEHSQSQ
ncbi:ferredoxin [Streptomyces cyaneofuscatus]|uniref:ferredoxin n=1 Tax=Streptomyces TaxID=1883 RepID=UPI003450F962